MIKVEILIPLKDNDGKDHAQATWLAFEHEILDVGDGFHFETGVHGVWRDEQGRPYREPSRRYTVALTSFRQISPLIGVVERALSAFAQYAIYVEVNGHPEIFEGES